MATVTLPNELLQRILEQLAPANLIAARGVCVRCRVVERDIEARDRAA